MILNISESPIQISYPHPYPLTLTQTIALQKSRHSAKQLTPQNAAFLRSEHSRNYIAPRIIVS